MTCSDSFFKPYLDAQDGKDIYEIIDRDYFSIPLPAHRDISNPDELCQTEKFVVVRYSVGYSEEYIVVGPRKNSIVEKLPGNMSCIYHELFNKKDRGWDITRCKYFLASEQQRYEREYGSICQLDRKNSGEYIERFTRLASFVGAATGDAQRQARRFKWGLKKWVLDRIVNTDYTNVTAVAAAARNIELLHESENLNKRDRDGVVKTRVLSIGVIRIEVMIRNDRIFGVRIRGSSGQRRSTETLPPPPLCATYGKPPPGVCYKATGGCFTCGSTQHKVKDCPQGKQKQSMST
nr:hypothetical protein [Tanacetum cinerariifolium]